MPVKEGSSKKVVSKNIDKLMNEGYPRKKAIAMAMGKSGKKKK
jgi:hypothetical protein